MTQKLKQSRWQRWMNNVDSKQEAIFKIVILIGLGIFIGVFFF